ncbi:MAG: hypothetical protein Q7R76_05755 [Candidatus Woesearchaeota archaeon]|nr:hypothetical protein [Candidatus Woesearchaeota archaeon]
MNITDVSWMEKPQRSRGSSNYLVLACILLALLAVGYISEHPSSITGFAVFEYGAVNMSIDFGQQKIPLGASVELTLNGQKYEKNLISILGPPYEITSGNATIYGWDADVVVPLETFDAVRTLPAGSYTVDVVLAYNDEIYGLTSETIEIIGGEQQPVPSPEFTSVEPVVQQPTTETPSEPTFVAPEELANSSLSEPTFVMPEELMNGSTNDSNTTAASSSDNFTVSDSPLDEDGDRFLRQGTTPNSTHPTDCDDNDNLTRPLRNGSNNSIQKNYHICPGGYNSTVTIDNSTVNFDCNSTVIFRPEATTGNFTYVIQSSGFSNINVTGCVVTNILGTSGHGIRFSNAANIKINHTTVVNATTGIVFNRTNDSAINGATIDNIITNDAIQLKWSNQRTNVSSNRISNILTPTAFAINLNGATTNSTIINNTINNVGTGIQALATNTFQVGVPSNNTITGNTIWNASVSAILSTGTSGDGEPNVPSNLSITKNYILNSTIGIQLRRTGNSTISDNELFNNTMQLNATNASGSTIINTSFNGSFNSLIDEGNLTVSVINHTFRTFHGIAQFPNFTTTDTQNFSSNRTDINMTNSLLFLDPATLFRVQNSSVHWTRFNTTYPIPPAVLKDDVSCDTSICSLISYSIPVMVVQVIGMGTYTITPREIDNDFFARAGLIMTSPRSFSEGSPPSGMPPSFEFSGVRPSERVARGAEAAPSSAKFTGGRMKSYIPKRLAFGQGLGLLEAKQDGKILFVNNKFGTDITVKPDQISTVEFTVVNTGTEVLNSIVLDVDASKVKILSQSSLHTQTLSRGEKAVFTLTLQPTPGQVTENSIALKWHAGGSYLDKEFNVRVEARPESRVTAAFIFKQWAAPSITVLVMFLTGTLLLVGIQTFAGGQVEKITQGIIGPVFRDTLVDEETLRRLVRSKFMSQYSTLWTTRSAYLKFKPQFSQLKLVKLSMNGMHAATEINARFHLGMEMATLIAFATRKKLIAQLDLMPGRVLTMHDLPIAVAHEYEGVDFVNPFGADVMPDKKLVLDSCIALPDYTAVLMEHLITGVVNGLTYHSLISELRTAGWPAQKIAAHITALKAERGYLKRFIMDAYSYNGFDRIDDEKLRAKTTASLLVHGHDKRLVALAFSIATKNYEKLYAMLKLSHSEHTPVAKVVSRLVKLGWNQKLIGHILLRIESEDEERKTTKKQTNKEKKEEEKTVSTSVGAAAPVARVVSPLPPLPPLLTLVPPRIQPANPDAPLRTIAERYPLLHSVKTSVVAKIADREEAYIRVAVDRIFTAAARQKPLSALEKTFMHDAMAELVRKGFDARLVEKIVTEQAPLLLARARVSEPQAQKKSREQLLRTTLQPSKQKPLAVIPSGSIITLLKEKLAVKEEAYLRRYINQLVDAEAASNRSAAICTTFVADTIARLVRLGYNIGLVERLVTEIVAARLLDTARQESPRQTIVSRSSLSSLPTKQSPIQPSAPHRKSADILVAVKKTIEEKEDDYIARFAEQSFAAASRFSTPEMLRATFVNDVVRQLAEKGHDATRARRIISGVFESRIGGVQSEQKKQVVEQRTPTREEPIKKTNSGFVLRLNRALLDFILAQREKGVQPEKIKEQLKNKYPPLVISFHLTTAEKELKARGTAQRKRQP